MAYRLKPCADCGGERRFVIRGSGVRCEFCHAANVQAAEKQANAPRRMYGPAIGLQDTERAHTMARLYQGGQTLAEIGAAFDVTRERVRQILKCMGLVGKHGGAKIRGVISQMKREAALKARRDKRCQATYGCDYATLLRLNGGKRGKARGSLAAYYFNQRRSADNRKVEWRISFPEWLGVWLESGKLSERGQGADKYCMARKGDAGPYSVGNVYITTCSGNIKDYYAELKVRGVRCADGYRRLPEKAARLGLAVVEET